MSENPTRRHGRHRARRRPSLRLRGIVGTTLALAGTTTVAVALSGGSYAMWMGQSSFSGGTVQSGTAALQITQSFSAAAWSNLLAGESVRQSFTVKNTGDVRLAVAASGTTQSAPYELRVTTGTCGTTPLTGTSITSTPASLGNLAAGATTTVCLEVKLSSAGTAGSTSTVGVTLTGTQS